MQQSSGIGNKENIMASLEQIAIQEPALVDQAETPQYLGSATYSPEDNKLRFYPFARLSKEDYQRARDAGFSWAPRQELFVASMWTPSRENLMLKWCGEIGDEDDTLMQRAEDRAERFDGYSERRSQEAEAARARVKSITDGIPLGQPILIGHHSERRARKDAQRIEDGMRKAVKLWDASEYWERRAEAAKAHAEYKERPDVRHRRIRSIEADLRKARKNEAEASQFGALWAVEGLSFEQARELANRGHFSVVESGQSWGTSAYSLLTRAENPWSVERVADFAVRIFDRSLNHSRRWIAHYENRLAYERAMLSEDGGIEADQYDIQPGGQVLVRGEWLSVVRVNRKDGRIVSVTTNCRFVRVKGIEKIRDYRAPSEEQAVAARAITKKPPLVNYPHPGALEMTQADWKHIHCDYKGTREAGQGAQSAGFGRIRLERADMPEVGRHRVRTVVRSGSLVSVFLTDAKVVQPPEASAGPQPAAPVLAPPSRDPQTVKSAVAAKQPEPAQVEIDAMRLTLKSGVQVVTAPQLFPTPDAVAAQVMDRAKPQIGARVLEPSAGTGALLRALPGVSPFPGQRQTACTVVAVEINANLARSLRESGLAHEVLCTDFLQMSRATLGRFDVIVMNPPFERGADIEHIVHAARFLAPGGRLVAVCAGGPRQQALFSQVGTFETLPAGSFASQGTMVNAALVTLTHEQAMRL